LGRVDDFLAIPSESSQYLGGVGWSSGGEAVEYSSDAPEIGMTFAMGGEISLFLEGFLSRSEQPIAFGYVLQLLYWLSPGRGATSSATSDALVEVRRAYQQWGRPLRHAGALCAELCQDVPRVPEPIDRTTLHASLTRPSSDLLGEARTGRAACLPLTPERFEEIFISAISKLKPEAIREWLQYGRGAIPHDNIARAVQLAQSRTVSALLARLETRRRLVGTTRLTSTLSSMIALPPRKLAVTPLPLGGYSDLTTRGGLEQILPSQLSLDEDEFVRRFAERELLFFRREDPVKPAPDELLIVLDQGIRTWGTVRPILAAATLALLKNAERKKTLTRIKTTSRPGPSIDWQSLNDEEIGQLLEASDLTDNPGLALAQALGAGSSNAPRDIVLLTHPRSLNAEEIRKSVEQLPSSSRLFALSIDDQRAMQLSELVQDIWITRLQSRVPIIASGATGTHDFKRRRLGPITIHSPWQGDLEDPGFPFRVGSTEPIIKGSLALDYEGNRLLFARRLGLLFAYNLDGKHLELSMTPMEVLPRALDLNRSPYQRVESIVGVRGGFVVVARMASQPGIALIHYDFTTRECVVHPRQGLSKNLDWSYLASHHTVIGQKQMSVHLALDLDHPPGIAGFSPAEGTTPSSVRAHEAYLVAKKNRPVRRLFVRAHEPLPESGRAIRLDPKTGAIQVQNDKLEQAHLLPAQDGKPILRNHWVSETRSGDDVILARIQSNIHARTFIAVSLDPILQLSCTSINDASIFSISGDGRRFAYPFGKSLIKIQDLRNNEGPRFVPKASQAHHCQLQVFLGDGVLVAKIGGHIHVLRWDRSSLEHYVGRGDSDSHLNQVFGNRLPTLIEMDRHHPLRSRDPDRYFAGCSCAGVSLVVDVMDQIILSDSLDNVICIFHIFRSDLQGWLPDGTYLKPNASNSNSISSEIAKRFALALASRGRSGREEAR